MSTLTLESEEIQVKSVMVEGPAVGKAGNVQDWIAGMESKTGAPYI